MFKYQYCNLLNQMLFKRRVAPKSKFRQEDVKVMNSFSWLEE
jgi:hypothetical protein